MSRPSTDGLGTPTSYYHVQLRHNLHSCCFACTLSLIVRQSCFASMYLTVHKSLQKMAVPKSSAQGGTNNPGRKEPARQIPFWNGECQKCQIRTIFHSPSVSHRAGDFPVKFATNNNKDVHLRLHTGKFCHQLFFATVNQFCLVLLCVIGIGYT